jgi:hypothetical protein
MRKILKDGGKTLTALTQEIVTAVQGLDEAKYKREKEMFQKVLLSAQGVMQQIAGYAKNNQYNLVLQNCTEFLNFASQMVIAWRLLESATLADSKMATASPADKKFYESKVTDFKVYCSHYLIHNLSMAKTISEFTEDVTALEI